MTDPTLFAALLAEIQAALAGRTTAFRNELRLHDEMAAAFTLAGIAFRHEVPVKGGGFADFVIRESCVIEVKSAGGKGRAPLRQLCRYLETGEFSSGILVMIRCWPMPFHHYETRDGRLLPIGKIELWKNAL